MHYDVDTINLSCAKNIHTQRIVENTKMHGSVMRFPMICSFDFWKKGHFSIPFFQLVNVVLNKGKRENSIKLSDIVRK